MTEKLLKQMLDSFEEKDVIKVVDMLIKKELFYISSEICEFFIKYFNKSKYLISLHALCLIMNKKYDKSVELYNILLENRNLQAKDIDGYLNNIRNIIQHVKDSYTCYNNDKIKQIMSKSDKNNLVTFSITTCKRFNLFKNTINSFINCCKDLYLIDEWICVDDNSSEEDRIMMKELYPFFKFYFKKKEEKGHPQSMNIIKKMVKTPYLFHMEDDWNFFVKRDYISECLEVLAQNKNIGQCLINKNYDENGKNIIKGGEFKITKSGLRYYIHEYVNNKQAEEKWISRHGYGSHCNYWPHYSLRPSLIKTKIFQAIGEYNENVSHFERDYSHRYVSRGYISAFLEGIYCIHTGRLTNEINDKSKLNAYSLNDEKQFVGKEKIITLENFEMKFKTYVVNMDKRQDRWDKFNEKAKDLKFLNYERFSAVDGTKLKKTPRLQVIFDGNDYNMRVGLVGCALSHIKLYIDLINSEEDAFLIFEDDLDFTPNFDYKLLHLYNNFKNFDWDLVYLGHHVINKNDKDVYNRENMPKVEKCDTKQSFTISYGGTGGYFISKKGAVKLLEYINRLGMLNGIDTMQQKAANELNVYYSYPHLYNSEMWNPRDNININTDIQQNFSSLTMPIEDRLKEELSYYHSIGEKVNKENIDNFLEILEDEENIKNCYFEGNSEKINDIKSLCSYSCYNLGNNILFIIPDDSKCRYKDRLKKDGKFFIEDVLCY